MSKTSRVVHVYVEDREAFQKTKLFASLSLFQVKYNSDEKDIEEEDCVIGARKSKGKVFLFEHIQDKHSVTHDSNFEDFYQIISATKTFLESQLNLAIGYNVIAIPIMAGALAFIFMPGPLVGAVLMNVFSIGLIYRSYALREQIEKRVNPKNAQDINDPLTPTEVPMAPSGGPPTDACGCCKK